MSKSACLDFATLVWPFAEVIWPCWNLAPVSFKNLCLASKSGYYLCRLGDYVSFGLLGVCVMQERQRRVSSLRGE